MRATLRPPPVLAVHPAWRCLALGVGAWLAWATPTLHAADRPPQEIHSRIAPNADHPDAIALTLDACSGRYDDELIDFLVRNRIPATLFVTKKWLDANPTGVATLKAHLDLFDLEDHGERHIPAVIGKGRRVYGIAGEPDLVHLRREVQGGAQAIERVVGVAPSWYRGATAAYDEQAADEIRQMGFKIAGFTVNADAGATLSRKAVAERLRRVQAGDVIIAHMNKPAGYTAEGMATGLLELVRRGLRFVRLDQVSLIEVPPKAKP